MPVLAAIADVPVAGLGHGPSVNVRAAAKVRSISATAWVLVSGGACA